MDTALWLARNFYCPPDPPSIRQGQSLIRAPAITRQRALKTLVTRVLFYTSAYKCQRREKIEYLTVHAAQTHVPNNLSQSVYFHRAGMRTSPMKSETYGVVKNTYHKLFIVTPHFHHFSYFLYDYHSTIVLNRFFVFYLYLTWPKLARDFSF